MTVALLNYSGRHASPDMIERAKEQLLSFEVQYAGAVVVPDSGTLTLRDPSDVAVVSAAVVAVNSSGIATYDLAAALVPATYAMSSRWMEEWTLTFSDGQVHTFRRDAHLVIRKLYCPVVESDLTRRQSDLSRLKGKHLSSLQPYIDDAWDSVVFWLLEDGRFPEKVMSPSSLTEWVKALALHRANNDIFANSAGGDDRFKILADFWYVEAEKARNRLKFGIYDHNGDNKPSGQNEEGEAGSPVVYLGGAPSSYEAIGRRR